MTISKWLIEHKESGLCISKDNDLKLPIDYKELIAFDYSEDAQIFINRLDYGKHYFAAEHVYL